MRLGDVKIGEKFYHLNEENKSDRMYLRIDMKLASMSLTTIFPDVVCVLDLTTYRVMCLNPEYEVEVEHDTVYI